MIKSGFHINTLILFSTHSLSSAYLLWIYYLQPVSTLQLNGKWMGGGFVYSMFCVWSICRECMHSMHAGESWWHSKVHCVTLSHSRLASWPCPPVLWILSCFKENQNTTLESSQGTLSKQLVSGNWWSMSLSMYYSSSWMQGTGMYIAMIVCMHII